jgi:hypothetical protein
MKCKPAISYQRSAISYQRSGVRGQLSAISGQGSGVSGQGSGVSYQRSGVSYYLAIAPRSKTGFLNDKLSVSNDMIGKKPGFLGLVENSAVRSVLAISFLAYLYFQSLVIRIKSESIIS